MEQFLGNHMVQTDMLLELFLGFEVVSTLMTVKSISTIFKLLNMFAVCFAGTVNCMTIWVGFVDPYIVFSTSCLTEKCSFSSPDGQYSFLLELRNQKLKNGKTLVS
jgi:hypothetical protein